MPKRNLKLTVAYDGTDFAGWQVQKAGRTVQGTIEAALERMHGEHVTVKAGNQSMIYTYDNAGKTSEAPLTLTKNDWTVEGVTKLSLSLRGASANAADRVYVDLNGTAVIYHDDPAATQTAGWTEWVIDLQAFADQGVDMTNVNTITIGIGTKGAPAAGGTGKMYIDDIRLYQ